MFFIASKLQFREKMAFYDYKPVKTLMFKKHVLSKYYSCICFKNQSQFL